MFFCKSCEIFKNIYFEKHLGTTASTSLSILDCYHSEDQSIALPDKAKYQESYRIINANVSWTFILVTIIIYVLLTPPEFMISLSLIVRLQQAYFTPLDVLQQGNRAFLLNTKTARRNPLKEAKILKTGNPDVFPWTFNNDYSGTAQTCLWENVDLGLKKKLQWKLKANEESWK